jgi:WD40 repeat protein/cellulose biosynthesis protein BcsQ
VITTFYSYKGGVGRTSLAVETAARLACGGGARQPLRVVLWDLDLEAPGIHYFPVVGELSGRAEAGTLDLLDLLWTTHEASGRAEDESEVSKDEIDDVLRRAVVTDPNVADGRLGVLAPNAGGRLDRERLIDLDLPKLFAGIEKAPALLRVAAERLRRALHYDIVIIDARTGVSDLAATATMGLPDTLVFVLRMDEQDLSNIESLLAAIRSSRAGGPGESDLHVVPVATFVPDPGENVELARRIDERRRELVTKVISPTATRNRLTVEIPFRLALLIDESVPSLEDLPLPRRANEAYELLAHELFDLASPPAGLPDAADVGRPGRVNRLPSRAATTRDAAAAFTELVTELLALDGWTVESTADDAGDLRIARTTTFGRPELGVLQCRSLPGRLDARRVQTFALSMQAHRLETPRLRGLIVSERGYTTTAARAADTADIDLVTPDDLLDALAPLDPVRFAARRDWEYTDLESRYVPIAAKRIELGTATSNDTEEKEPLEDRALGWLRGGPSKGLLAILGDSGSGKTTFVRRLAYRLATDTTGTLPIALVVDLKTARSRALSADSFIDHALASAGVPDVKHEAWRYRLTRTRSVVLIVDGFDEMLGYTDPPAMRGIILELLDLARDTRIILTSRTNYFISHEEAVRHFDAGALNGAVPGTELWNEVAQHGSTEVLEILPFTREMVHEYLERVFKGRGAAIADRLDAQPNLAAIARRPYLLTLMARTIGQWESQRWPARVNLTELYDAYVAAWDEERTEGRVAVLQTKRADRAIDIVAKEAWSAGGTTLTSDQLAAIVQSAVLPAWQTPFEPQLADRLTDELRTATFLSREGTGDRYAFVHSSFLEFFVARGIASALRASDPQRFAKALSTRRFTPEIGTFLLGWSETLRKLDTYCQDILGHEYRPQISENALLLLVQRKRQQVTGSKARPITVLGVELQLPGAQLSGVNLAGVDLSQANLRGAKLDGAHLTGAILERADLRTTLLDGAVLSQVRAQGARLGEAVGRNVKAAGADFTDADLSRGVFDGIALRGGNLTRANLQDARCAMAVLDDAILTDARLERADFRSAAIRTSHLPSIPSSVRVSGARVGWPLRSTVSVETATLRTGHYDAIRDAAVFVLTGGTKLVTGGDDGTIRIWDPATARHLTRIRCDGKIKTLTALAAPDRPLMVAATEFGTLTTWELDSYSELCSSEVLSDSVDRLSSGVIGGIALFAMAGSDASVQVRTMHDHTVAAAIPGHTAAVRAICLVPTCALGSVVVSADDDGVVRVSSFPDGNPLQVWRGHDGPVATLAINADTVVSGGLDGRLRLWHFGDAYQRAELTEDGPVLAAAFCGAQRHLLASVSAGGRIRIRDLQAGRDAPVAEMSGLPGVTALRALQTEDGNLLASVGHDGVIRIWDPLTGQRLHTLRNPLGALRSMTTFRERRAAVISASMPEPGLLSVWGASDGRHLHTLRAPTSQIVGVAKHGAPHGPLLAGARADGSIVLWNPLTAKEGKTLSGHTGQVFKVRSLSTPLGPRAVSAGEDGTVRIWDPLTGEELHVLRGHGDWVRDVAAVTVAQTSLVGSGGDDGSLRIWNGESGLALQAFDAQSSPVLAVEAYSDAGHAWFVSIGLDEVARIWDPKKDAAVGEIDNLGEGAAVLATYSSRSDLRLAVGDSQGVVTICDLRRRSVIRRIALEGEAISTLSVTAAPSVAPLVCARDEEGVIHVLDPERGRPLYRLASVPATGDVLTVQEGLPLGEATPANPAIRGTPEAIDAGVIAGGYDGREIRHVMPDAVATVKRQLRRALGGRG